MAFDGIVLSAVKNEIDEIAVGSRVDKIYQPSKDEIIFLMRFRGGSVKLLINVGANSPRIHFTGVSVENPKSPPMFCMLLRKHLNSGKLISAEQLGTDRVLKLNFESTNELGDIVNIIVAVEIMGRHSNLILINQDGRVIDSIKRVDDSMSSVRRILPGVKYILPPMQDKLALTESTADAAVDRIKACKEPELAKCIMSSLQGISPILSREAVQYAARTTDLRKDDADEEIYSRLRFFLDELIKNIRSGEHRFTMVSEKNGKPKDFTVVPVNQYGAYMLTRQFDSVGALLDSFYSERDRVERMKQRSHSLLKLLVNASERVSRKLYLQKQELAESKERETKKKYGDIISANFYTLKKGMTSASLDDFYTEGMPKIKVKLDPALTPQENAQKYYREYRKAATAEKYLKQLIASAERELEYIDSVFDAVSRTTGESELFEIREELIEQGYLKRSKKQKKNSQKPLPPVKYISSDGFVILCGRNNRQNDLLTLKKAKGADIWCHTHNIPGSHVIIASEFKDVPETTIEEACKIAAFNSKARGSSQVPVDYTFAKNVKKPNGAKPGMVIFDNNKTVFITPDEQQVKNLLSQS